MATWDPVRDRGRVEVLFGRDDRELFDHAQQRAARLGLSLPEYLRQLARAAMLAQQGDPALLGLLGVQGAPAPAAPPPSAPAPAAPANNKRVDSVLDQLGL
ncbi:MAG TPA: hypothetical protein VFS21_03045 [Roseiflexaceae bacterium]|nr:hypothetical protein [Roseiflexaceae bacterium]